MGWGGGDKMMNDEIIEFSTDFMYMQYSDNICKYEVDCLLDIYTRNSLYFFKCRHTKNVQTICFFEMRHLVPRLWQDGGQHSRQTTR